MKTLRRGKLRFSILGIACIAALCACSAGTRYILELDAGSFLEEEQRSGSATVPEDSPLALYILPAINDTLLDVPPAATYLQGYTVDLPTAYSETGTTVPEAARVRIRLDAEVTLTNHHETNSLPGSRTSLFIAPAGTEDVYTEGDRIAQFETESIAPGETGTIRLSASRELDQKTRAILRSGGLQIGGRVVIPNTPGISVPFDYRLSRLEITLSGLPFGFIP